VAVAMVASHAAPADRISPTLGLCIYVVNTGPLES
jgi:hypothetical protein